MSEANLASLSNFRDLVRTLPAEASAVDDALAAMDGNIRDIAEEICSTPKKFDGIINRVRQADGAVGGLKNAAIAFGKRVVASARNIAITFALTKIVELIGGLITVKGHKWDKTFADYLARKRAEGKHYTIALYFSYIKFF